VLRILVIDDETPVRKALERVLSVNGEVESVTETGSGLARLSEAKFDLVILDGALPDVAGVEAIRQIRRDHPQTRIIAISGGDNMGLASYRPEAISTHAYLAACLHAGAHATLAKPFETDELRGLIDQVMRTAAGT
jgi:CheY-like chemotaxis protein